MASPSGSKRRPSRRWRSKKARSTRRSTAWSARGRSRPSGGCRSWAARPSSTSSRPRGASSSRPKPSSGRVSPPRSRRSSSRLTEGDPSMRWLWKKSVDDEVSGAGAPPRDADPRIRRARHGPGRGARAALRRFGDLENRAEATCREIGRKRERTCVAASTSAELRQDVTFAVRQLVAPRLQPHRRAHARARHRRARPRSSAPSTRWCCGRCRCPGPSGSWSIYSEVRGQPPQRLGGQLVDGDGAGAPSRVAREQYSNFNLAEGRRRADVGARVSASFFDVFGVPAGARPRVHADEDQPGREQVVVLSHRLWKRRFGADPAIVGRDIRMNGQP